MALLLIIRIYQLSQRHLAFNCILLELKLKLYKVASSVAQHSMEKMVAVSRPMIVKNAQVVEIVSACANAMAISSLKIGNTIMPQTE